MRLKLNQISVDCVIGDRPDERDRLQTLAVDVELEISDLAGETDSLADTVDYVALTEGIRAKLVAEKCQMIERAAYLACEQCFAVGGGRVFSARVSVTKTGAIANLKSATAICERRAE